MSGGGRGLDPRFMQELKQKCEVETTYIDNGGATFVTAHAFDAE